MTQVPITYLVADFTSLSSLVILPLADILFNSLDTLIRSTAVTNDGTAIKQDVKMSNQPLGVDIEISYVLNSPRQASSTVSDTFTMGIDVVIIQLRLKVYQCY